MVVVGGVVVVAGSRRLSGLSHANDRFWAKAAVGSQALGRRLNSNERQISPWAMLLSSSFSENLDGEENNRA